VRDLAPVTARGEDGATTVAATSHLAHLAGIKVFATGGLGGVHRGAQDSFDESADLGTLARTPICVVCAGVKSILDIPATLERLETLNVTVLGYGTNTFPAFYLTSSGIPITWRVDTPEQAAAVLVQRDELRAPGAVVVANPLDEQLDPELHDRTLAEGLAAAAEQGISGRDVTPFLLERFHSHTEGESLRANVRLVLRNAALAAEIAAAL
jgi:pseudouridine-5'-phosphate glycosidase